METTKTDYTNLEMNANTFSKRREIMGFVYEAKNLLKNKGVQIPRIEIRITAGAECSDALGIAALDTKKIWIPERLFDGTWEPKHKRHVVFHEMVHTLTGNGHDEKCFLMSKALKASTSQDKVHKAFLKYFA